MNPPSPKRRLQHISSSPPSSAPPARVSMLTRLNRPAPVCYSANIRTCWYQSRIFNYMQHRHRADLRFDLWRGVPAGPDVGSSRAPSCLLWPGQTLAPGLLSPGFLLLLPLFPSSSFPLHIIGYSSSPPLSYYLTWLAPRPPKLEHLCLLHLILI